MNNNLRLRIGQKMSVITRIRLDDGSFDDEYIQGVLKNVEGDVITIRQYFPYYKFVQGEKELPYEDRMINVANYQPLSKFK